MKFVTELKEDYLYKIVDLDTSEIILVTKLDGKYLSAETLNYDYNKDIDEDFLTSEWNTFTNIISKYKEIDKLFDNTKYAFYELGYKDDFPEYFI